MAYNSAPLGSTRAQIHPKEDDIMMIFAAIPADLRAARTTEAAA